jgi:hypothetical protein
VPEAEPKGVDTVIGITLDILTASFAAVAEKDIGTAVGTIPAEELKTAPAPGEMTTAAENAGAEKRNNKKDKYLIWSH